MITELVTITLIPDGQQLPTTRPILDRSLFQTKRFLVFYGLLSAVRALCALLLLYLILYPYFQAQVQLRRGCLVSIAPMSSLRRQYSPNFRELWIFDPIISITVGRWYFYRKRNEFMALRIELLGLDLHYETSRVKHRLLRWASKTISRICLSIVVYLKMKLFEFSSIC